ncbi:multiple sugar transport system substrate-binding protein [Microbacterium ginsengiterrae]|uniref:Multiple sugar transport system substrate-binding protein n=1 Tax=Microbacterium ginsengiterrae TaxID=546115 RepID=A0A7W9CC47_9MICO|nr:ABC transporter substrate-binding protein [Microbacterium ginsengiterrae]MBB5742883.1 multiple sugar transport system substrate-binding protein [Microbacterium ginsengiterrae]
MQLQHQKTWRVVGAAAMAAVTVAGLAGCASGGADADGKTEITFSYLWGGAEAEALEEIIADFNDSQDEIVVKGVSSPDQQKQLTSMSSSNGSFDISDNFGNNVGAWASKGVLAPLDEAIAAEGIDIDDFIPSAMEQMIYDGTTYALPIAIHSFQLLYNKTLLDEAGITPPTTMDELAAAAQALTVEEDGKITRLGLGSANDSTTLTTLGFAFGGSWDDADGPTPADAGNLEALEWYQENIIEPVGAEKMAAFVSGQGEYLSAQDPFFSGKVAMIIDGEWRSASAANVAPELDWGVTAIPAASPELENSTQVTASTLFIPANSTHKEEAATFLAYLVSDEPMEKFSLALGNLPGRTSLAGSEVFSELENFEVWADAATSPNAKSLASAPYSAEYAADLKAAFDEIVRLTSTPEEAIATVESRMSSYSSK